ncbi:MAG: flippase-like domain-containing protein [Sphingomonadales bacterium]|nr:flippase-like domain-containing protein [Sphingomonadales bacterium]
MIGTVLHWGELERFARLVREAEPAWMGFAIALQALTYLSVAAGWSAVLAAADAPQPLGKLMRVAIIKLFADQTMPSAGMGGNVVLVDQLHALGAPRSAAVAALLISMVGYYCAYALFAVAMMVLLWLHDQATPLMAGLVTLFLAIAFAIPALALWLRRRGSRPLPRRIERIGLIRELLRTVAQAPAKLMGNRRLLAKVALCNALVFLADAGTLYCCLHVLGQSAAFATAFIALIMASIMMTLSPIPLGLGTFEATSTATLHLLGVPLESAFAATMLLRLLTLWLPMLPGIVLVRRATRRPGIA